MNKKILIVDDEGSDRKGMAVVLGKEGYGEIMVADTGEAGVQLAKSFRPDIVLIDVVLQEKEDGLDICKKIKSDPDNHAKVIMITGHLDAVDANKARISGADEIIEKIPGFENVGEMIRRLSL